MKLAIQNKKILTALRGRVTLATMTRRDLSRFLTLKDTHGKTQVHGNSCPFLGQRGRRPCGCSLQLSIKRSIRISVNYAQSFMPLVEMVTGINVLA